MQGKPVAEQEIGTQLLLDTVSYAESSVCRRKILLHYFGEKYQPDNCNACDNCLHPKEKIEAKDEMVIALNSILAVNQKYKMEHITNILIGNKNAAIKSFKHDTLEIFAQGKEKDSHFWHAIYRQAMIAGLISKDIENYGLLKITEKGYLFLEKPTSFMMVLNTDFQFIATSVTGDVICANDIPPGTYYVLIADENNCWIFKTIVIEPSAGFDVEGEVTHESCAGNDGAIDLTVTGTGPFYFQWSNTTHYLVLTLGSK